MQICQTPRAGVKKIKKEQVETYLVYTYNSSIFRLWRPQAEDQLKRETRLQTVQCGGPEDHLWPVAGPYQLLDRTAYGVADAGEKIGPGVLLVPRDRWGEVNLLTKFQLPSSYGLGMKVF